MRIPRLVFEEAQATLREYDKILMIHHHDPVKLSRLARQIERTAFLDGYYFACAMHCCHLCRECRIDMGKPCHTPLNIRPCDQSFGVDVYKTARNWGSLRSATVKIRHSQPVCFCSDHLISDGFGIHFGELYRSPPDRQRP